jgi:hypothetical protein
MAKFCFVDNDEVFFCFDNSSTSVIALGGSEFTMHYAIGWRERERERIGSALVVVVVIVLLK